MAKFKVGDRVIANEQAEIHYSYVKVGDTGTVTAISDSSFGFKGDDGYRYIGLDYDYFDLISFTKKDLQDGDIVTLRNNNRLIYVNEGFHDESHSLVDNVLTDITDIDYELCYDDDHSNDIIKVTRPTKYVEVFSRKEVEQPKKLTVSDICEILGYDIEIVKEDKE